MFEIFADFVFVCFLNMKFMIYTVKAPKRIVGERKREREE